MSPAIKISPQALADFKAIYQEEIGESLSDEQAQEMALRLLRLVHLLCRPPCQPAD